MVRSFSIWTLHRLEYYEALGKAARLRSPRMHLESIKSTVEEVQDGDDFNFEVLLLLRLSASSRVHSILLLVTNRFREYILDTLT